MMRFLFNGTLVLILTLLTQIGGLVWLSALLFRRPALVFLPLYLVASLAMTQMAPLTGRVPLPCRGDGALVVQSPLYCALNRHYVSPPLHDTATALATWMERAYPGTQTLALDANFPFLDGFPLLPHLSHDDGEKLDLAFYYQTDDGYQRGATRSPIGYFAFEDGPTDCQGAFPTMRWNMRWLEPLWRQDLRLDAPRMQTALRWLADDPRVGKIFVEPHLKDSLGLRSAKIRFQGCRAARHDDHIHIQL